MKEHLKMIVYSGLVCTKTISGLLKHYFSCIVSLAWGLFELPFSPVIPPGWPFGQQVIPEFNEKEHLKLLVTGELVCTNLKEILGLLKHFTVLRFTPAIPSDPSGWPL